MSRKRILFIYVGAIGLASLQAAFAQSETPVPKPPYLAPVPDYAHWTIKIKTLASVSPKPGEPAPKVETGQPVMLDTVRTKDVTQVTVYYSGAPPEVFNEKNGTIFVQTSKGVVMMHDVNGSFLTPSTDAPIAADPDEGFKGPYPFYSRGFVFADFIGRKGLSSFTSVVLYNQVHCFHYQDGDYEAWIDVDTMLPVATKHGGIEADFQFLAAPTSPLQLPPEEAASLQKTEDALKAFNAVR